MLKGRKILHRTASFLVQPRSIVNKKLLKQAASTVYLKHGKIFISGSSPRRTISKKENNIMEFGVFNAPEKVLSSTAVLCLAKHLV